MQQKSENRGGVGGSEMALEALGIDWQDSGAGWAVARCPLHQDNAPSLSLNMERGTWKCFAGCGQGNWLDLATRMIGVGYKINLTTVMSVVDNKGDPLLYEHREGELQKVLKALGGPERNQVQPDSVLDPYRFYSQYIEARGISREVAQQFDIGFDINEKRITIAIKDHSGRIRGIESRTCKVGVSPKYYPIIRCDKSTWLWGSHVHGVGCPIVVFEGALGAARAATLGVPGATAILGSSASDSQLDRLRQSPFVRVALDPDAAGREGSRKIYEALYRSTPVKVYTLPQDIDEIGAPDLMGLLFS